MLLLVRCGQFYLSSNQIAGFFVHQDLWKESYDVLHGVLHGVHHQVQVSSETLTFG